MTHLVFVYGSLKEGFHNHRLLSEGGAEPLGIATTARPYLMVRGYGFPYLIDPAALTHMVDLSGMTGKVKGELYDVDDDCFAALDTLEGHPDYYQREQVMVRPEDHPEPVAAWVYFLRDPSDTMPTVFTWGDIVEPTADGTVQWTEADLPSPLPDWEALP